MQIIMLNWQLKSNIKAILMVKITHKVLSFPLLICLTIFKN